MQDACQTREDKALLGKMLEGNQLGGFGEHDKKRRITKRSVFRPYASIFGFPFLFGMPSRRIAE
jgi:hypothetical protein